MIRLSNLQRKTADRLAGIELMIPWPPGLAAPTGLREGDERDARPIETAAAHTLLAAELERLRLEIVAVAVAIERAPPPAARLPVPLLAVTITGQRWVAKRRQAPLAHQPRTMWILS